MLLLNSLHKKSPHLLLNLFDESSDCHRWGSEARNSPLVALTHHTRRVEALFCGFTRELSQCKISCTDRKAFKESMRDRSIKRTYAHCGVPPIYLANIKPQRRLCLYIISYATLDSLQSLNILIAKRCITLGS